MKQLINKAKIALLCAVSASAWTTYAVCQYCDPEVPIIIVQGIGDDNVITIDSNGNFEYDGEFEKWDMVPGAPKCQETVDTTTCVPNGTTWVPCIHYIWDNENQTWNEDHEGDHVKEVDDCGTIDGCYS